MIELKVCDFEPGFISQLNMYQNIVNDVLRHPDNKSTIGLLLVKGKNETVVEYSLAGYQNPIGVAEWKNRLPSHYRRSCEAVFRPLKKLKKSWSNCATGCGTITICALNGSNLEFH